MAISMLLKQTMDSFRRRHAMVLEAQEALGAVRNESHLASGLGSAKCATVGEEKMGMEQQC